MHISYAAFQMGQVEPTVDWAFTCDYALIDQANKLSIIGIFDRLFVGAFPGMHHSLFLVAAWAGPADSQLASEVRLWNAAGELVATVQQQINFGPDGKSRGLIQISPVPLSVPGEYTFEFFAGGQSIKHHKITVEVIAQQGQAQ